ncbi:MAG: hypothetical protein H7836_12655 [Magnetococcus sp. YQC-3]
MDKQHALTGPISQTLCARNDAANGADQLSVQITAHEKILHKRLKALHIELIEARNTLLSLLDADPSSFVRHLKKMQSASDRVDATLATAAHQWKELAATWAAFKKIRDEQIIPAILSGHQEKDDMSGKTAPSERCEPMCAILINHQTDLAENCSLPTISTRSATQ